tara:strand:+ start:40 stop:681 length:642 start_codon:yes stop_codon:yes gene_type:complete
MAILFPDTAGQLTDGSFTHTEGGLTWIWNGTSWRSSGGTLDTYVLPTASTSVLGGVKVDGTTVTISNGVISSAGGGGGGGGGGTSLGSRQTFNASTSAAHANNTAENITITAYKGYALYKVKVAEPAWVSLYVSSAARTADASRSITMDPTPGSGVIAEVITQSTNETVLFTPAVIGYNDDSTPSTNVYLKVQNRSGSTQSINVELTVTQLEA